jgi:peptidyl-prolyl cis-trans isomerase B (cyclophilin B)
VIDSAQSQFFINVADNPIFDHKSNKPEQYGYCVFGQVVDGLDVLDKIAAVEVQDTDIAEQMPITPVIIKSVSRAK